MNIIALSVVSIAALMCNGCTTKPPSCDDQMSVDLLKKLFNKTVDEQWERKEDGMSGQLTVKISNIRTIEFNADEKRYSCEAYLSAEIKPLPDDPVFYNSEGVEKVISAAKKNIGIYSDIYNGVDLKFRYGHMAAEYASNLQKLTGTFGGKYLGKTGETTLGNGGFSGRVKYISTISKDETGGSKHYIEATGLDKIAAAYPVIVSTHVSMLKDKALQEEQ